MFVCFPPLPAMRPEEFSRRTPLWSTMMKPYLSGNGHLDPKQANGNDSGQLALSPQVLICPPPLLGHHPMVTSLLDKSKVIIRPIKDGNGNRTFELGRIVTMSCHRWYSNAKQTPRKPTLRPSGTRWSEELFREPPIPGLSPCSQPPEDVPTREPGPEVAPMQSTEEPFACPATPCLIIINYDTPVGSLPSSSPTPPPSHPVPHPSTPTPVPSQCKAPLIPTMTLARNFLTYNPL
ncbi:hypothetical protein O181_086905 [Austropuccinia psidii MF-1]|uniref:Uncharacterized protein n=1 Tax=Austropuccinia psidii MF-1 TaxID=1389203 RepID=A0A9Q3P0V8_9BASI|nr:hypothetical protein [Austropuccinia psidii MF-1]